MDVNEIATKQDIYRLENLLHKILMGKSDVKEISDSPTDMVSEKKAIEILGIKKSTLHCMKSMGKIAFYKPEGQRKGVSYYKISDLEKYMSGIKHQSTAEIEAEADKYMLEHKII